MSEWLNSLVSRLRQQKGMTTWVWLVILIVVLGIGTVMGMPFDRPETGDGSPAISVFGSTGQLISVFLKWMAVIGLMYVAFIFLKRWQPGGVNGQVKQITVIERLSLSQRQAILLVRVGSRKLLLGATDQNISMITELEEGDETPVELKAKEADHEGEGGNGFNSVLQKKLNVGPGDIFGGFRQKKE